jgi:hypothetical protein
MKGRIVMGAAGAALLAGAAAAPALAHKGTGGAVTCTQAYGTFADFPANSTIREHVDIDSGAKAWDVTGVVSGSGTVGANYGLTGTGSHHVVATFTWDVEGGGNFVVAADVDCGTPTPPPVPPTPPTPPVPPTPPHHHHHHPRPCVDHVRVHVRHGVLRASHRVEINVNGRTLHRRRYHLKPGDNVLVINRCNKIIAHKKGKSPRHPRG